MGKLKRLATKEDEFVIVESPISDTEVDDRKKHYDELEPLKFARRYNGWLFKPTVIRWNGNSHEIQFNHCIEPFCKSFSKHQITFDVKGKPKRYKLWGSAKHRSQVINCNPDPLEPHIGATLNCYTTPLSNWAIAEEIARLVRIEQVKDWEPEYEFHKEDCIHEGITPSDESNLFYKQGKSQSNSQRWQCKVCKKKTNVLPNQRQKSNYHQKRNDILPTFMKLLLNKTPITRTCEVLGIGNKTYYTKLEWLYRKCLEFLDRHERKPLQEKEFRTLYINTDKLIYFLNNIRKKGQGGERYEDLEDAQFPTHVVISGESFSRYILRADVAYEWDITIEDIKLDTILCKDDHLNRFAKKNERLRFPHYPMPPTKKDSQTKFEYNADLAEITRRSRYMDGLHTNSTYTTVAHYWLMKQLLTAQKWRLITDEDNSIMTALYRVFASEIDSGDAHHFLCKVERDKDRKDAYMEFRMAKDNLIYWGKSNGHDTNSLYKLAYLFLEDKFRTHKFHEIVHDGSKSYHKWAKNPVEHPLASIDKGYHYVDCKTDLSGYKPSEIANLILNINDHATNAFMQQIRRRLSILERPLVTARGDGKSYIYANFNPKYAQYTLTILRTFYNFCLPFKSSDGKGLTPAQRLGITDKQFDLNDIIYFR